MGQLIEGQVAQILSENIVILNVGAEAGARMGMVFAVLARGDEVKDPATGKPLGQWEVPKGCLRVTHVQERMCTCEGFDPRRAGSTDESGNVLSAALITHSMHPETWRDSAAGAALNVNRAQMTGLPAIGPVSVGDPVRQIERETERSGNQTTGSET